MNLIVDVGNTFVKVAIFHDRELLQTFVFSGEEAPKEIGDILKEHPSISHAIISSVGKSDQEFSLVFPSSIHVISLNSNTKVPFVNDYETPETLGVDRIALAAAACYHFPKQPVLIIDAGTCITYDLKDGNDHYLGGAISPGMQMRYKAVHEYTAKLPRLEPEKKNLLYGGSTKDSLHIGIIKGLLHEIDGFIYDYREKYPALTTILTGGDAHFLRDSIKNDIFANSNFLLEGLNYILDYNID